MHIRIQSRIFNSLLCDEFTNIYHGPRSPARGPPPQPSFTLVSIIFHYACIECIRRSKEDHAIAIIEVPMHTLQGKIKTRKCGRSESELPRRQQEVGNSITLLNTFRSMHCMDGFRPRIFPCSNKEQFWAFRTD